MSKKATLTSLNELVVEEDYLGAVYQLTYDNALVVTNDFRQITVGGVAQNSFLTVAGYDAEGEIDEVILLSVIGPEPLLTQRELVQVREELASQQVTTNKDTEVDPQTEARLGTQALRCKVVGTFYKDEDHRIRFGADIDSIRGSALLRVYRPQGLALSRIASFTNNSINENARLEVGKVRYTETRKAIDTDAAMLINVDDIIGAKTALLGLTRSGKSNSMKIILQKVHEYSHGVGKPVAQLILDPQGEYASFNSQDGNALVSIGDESQVAIYKLMDKSANPKEKFLQFNLFEEVNLPLTFELIKAEISAGISAEANYIAPLMAMNFELLGENASKSQKIHYARKKMGLFALMYESLGNYPVQPFAVPVGTDLAAEIVASSSKSVALSSYSIDEVLITSTQGASKVAASLMREKSAGGDSRLSESWVTEFEEGDAGKFFEQLEAIKEKGRNGVKAAISRIEELHSSRADGDVRENVWHDIEAGKLIVVDLSRGSTKTSQALSELIVNYLLDQASDNFVNGRDPVPFQIVVEEAHNLFERDGNRGDRDPWVRISKEAAKYKIGLVYATQEVSSVDRKILSNTHNWIISQLISNKELNELANYYQFVDWLSHIRRVETKGFVRMKTASSPYIIPVQIERFFVNSDAPVTSKNTSKTKPAAPSSDDPFQF